MVSILDIIYLIFPQIQQYFSSQNLVKAEQQKLDMLKTIIVFFPRWMIIKHFKFTTFVCRASAGKRFRGHY